MEWTPIELDLGPLPPRKLARYPLLSIYQAVARYREKFLQGRLSTNRLYREFCRAQVDTPSLNTVLAVAPLAAVLKEVEQPGWEYRVLLMPDPREWARRPDKAELARRQHARLRKRAGKPSSQRVLQIVRRSQPATVTLIQSELGWPITRVRYYLQLLRDAGLIEFTAPTQSKSQSYRELKTAPPLSTEQTA